MINWHDSDGNKNFGKPEWEEKDTRVPEHYIMELELYMEKLDKYIESLEDQLEMAWYEIEEINSQYYDSIIMWKQYDF